jgi:polar amino acid transport system substrate-binding protein
MHRIFLTVSAVLLAWSPVQAGDAIHVVDSDYPPFTYRKDNAPAGFSIEVLQEMAKRADVALTIDYYPFRRAVAMSTTEKNALITSMSRNEERNKQYQWIGPVYTATINLYRLKERTDLQIASLDQIGTRTIGTGAGFKIIDDLVKAGIDRKQIEDVSPENLNITKLFKRRVDYVALNDWVFAYLVAQEGKSFSEVEKVMALDGKEAAIYGKQTATGGVGDGAKDDSAAYYAVQKDTDPAVVARLQAALDAMRTDGAYDKIMQQYFK